MQKCRKEYAFMKKQTEERDGRKCSEPCQESARNN